MANFYGADVAELRQLGRELTHSAEQIGSVISRVKARVDNAAWRGPDAEGFRANWSGHHSVILRAAQRQLLDAAAQAVSNAQAQQEASGSATSVAAASGSRAPVHESDSTSRGGDWMPGMLVADQGTADNIRSWYEWRRYVEGGGGMSAGVVAEGAAKFLNLPAMGLPVSMHDVFSFMPGANLVVTASDLADDITHGRVPWNEGAQAVGETLRDEGFHHHNWQTYLTGTGVSLLSEAALKASKTDFSSSTFNSAVQYLATNPSDAASAVRDAIVHEIPTIVKSFWITGGTK